MGVAERVDGGDGHRARRAARQEGERRDQLGATARVAGSAAREARRVVGLAHALADGADGGGHEVGGAGALDQVEDVARARGVGRRAEAAERAGGGHLHLVLLVGEGEAQHLHGRGEALPHHRGAERRDRLDRGSARAGVAGGGGVRQEDRVALLERGRRARGRR